VVRDEQDGPVGRHIVQAHCLDAPVAFEEEREERCDPVVEGEIESERIALVRVGSADSNGGAMPTSPVRRDAVTTSGANPRPLPPPRTIADVRPPPL
jgi:hypothetical protein